MGLIIWPSNTAFGSGRVAYLYDYYKFAVLWALPLLHVFRVSRSEAKRVGYRCKTREVVREVALIS